MKSRIEERKVEQPQVIDLRIAQITKLQAKRDDFVKRLDEGAAKIEERRIQGGDVTLWEDFWIDLLRQYDEVCKQLRDLHTMPRQMQRLEKEKEQCQY